MTYDTPRFLLAQDGAAGLPGETTAAPGGNGNGAAPAAPPPSGFGPSFMFILVGVFVLVIIFSTMGPRRERKRREAMISAIKKHDRVQTVGGVIGSIVEIKPDFVVLKVDESSNTRITFAKSAIQQVLSSSDESKASSTTSPTAMS